jgi:HPt (histidine-containing phosphotransfer) domain-containing protein
VLPFESIEGLIAMFLAEVDGHLARIANYLAEGDYEKLAREAHIVVSTAGNIGAMQFSALAHSMEQKCKAAQLELVPELVKQLTSCRQAMISALNAWLDARRPNAPKKSEQAA